MLSKHPDQCKFPHGHSRKVEFVLEADSLDENEMVCDFKILKEAMKDYLDSLDHAMCMNTDDPKYEDFKAIYGERIIDFIGMDPTSEMMARTRGTSSRASISSTSMTRSVRRSTINSRTLAT